MVGTMLKNSQIQSIMMVLGVGGTALAGHLEARRQRRFRVIGRVLDFVADIPPMEIFPSLLHVAGQVSTANPDAWRSLLHDLASISQERFDLKEVIEASMHGMMLAMHNVGTDAGQAPDKSGAAHANGGVTAAECERVLVREAIARLEDKLGEVLRELADERRRPAAPTNSGETDKVMQAMLMAIDTFRHGLPVEQTKEVIATADLLEEALKGMAEVLATVCKGPSVQQDSTSGELGELRSPLAHEEQALAE